MTVKSVGKRAVTKGKAGERELISKLVGIIKELPGGEDVFDKSDLVRNVHQSRSGGSDVALCERNSGKYTNDVFGYAIEVKRYATQDFNEAWWTQACDQAADMGALPALCTRKNGGKWSVFLYAKPCCSAKVDFRARISLEDFAKILVSNFHLKYSKK